MTLHTTRTKPMSVLLFALALVSAISAYQAADKDKDKDKDKSKATAICHPAMVQSFFTPTQVWTFTANNGAIYSGKFKSGDTPPMGQQGCIDDKTDNPDFWFIWGTGQGISKGRFHH